MNFRKLDILFIDNYVLDIIIRYTSNILLIIHEPIKNQGDIFNYS